MSSNATINGKPWIGILLVVMTLGAVAEVNAQVPEFSKFFDPDTIGPGSTTTLTFTITNGGPTPASNLAFTDVLPMDVNIADPASASTTCVNGVLSIGDDPDSISLSDGQLGSGETCTVTVNVTASVVGEGPYINTTGDLTSSAGISGTATAELIVDDGRPRFSKSFSPNSIPLGGTSTLTFTVDNTVNGAGLDYLQFLDLMPAGLVIATLPNASTDCDAGFGVTFSADPGTSVISFVAVGLLPSDPVVAAFSMCTISVDVTTDGTGVFVNTSQELLLEDPQSVQDPDMAGFATGVLEVPVEFLNKSFTDDPVAPGNSVTLEFTINNPDRDNTATSIAFVDDLEAVLPGLLATGFSASECGGTVSTPDGGMTLEFTDGSLPPGGSCTFSVTLMVPAGATPDTYTNTTTAIVAVIDGQGMTGNMATDELFVVPAPILTKEFTNDPVSPGGTVDLTFTIQNNSATSTFTDLAFEDVFFDGLPTAAPPSSDCGGTTTFTPLINPSGNGGGNETIPAKLVLSDGILGPGASCTIDITLDVAPDAANGSYPNTTSIITATIGTTPVEGPPASDDLDVVAPPDLSKVFIYDPTAVAALPGGTVMLEFTLTHSENATTDATNISFTDDLDAALSGLVASALPADGFCGAGSQLTGTDLLTMTGGSLAPGASCTFSVTLDVPISALSGSYTNTTSNVAATVAGTMVTGNQAVDDLQVAALILTKEFTDDPVDPGGAVTLEFTIDLDENATTDATNIIFTDNLSQVLSGLASTSGTLDDICGTGSQITGTTLLIFTGGNLTPGGSCSFSVSLDVPAGATPDTYPNTTSDVQATIDGSVIQLPAASDELTIADPVPTIAITKSFTDDPVAAGDVVTLEFTIGYNGPTDATDIAFTDDLDAVLSGLVSINPTQNDVCGVGSQLSGTGVLTLTGGILAPGGFCTFTVTLQAPAGAAEGSYTNTTSDVTADVGGMMVVGSPTTDQLDVFDEPEIVVTKVDAFAGTAPQPGDGVIYTVSITNVDDRSASGVVFNDTVDGNTTLDCTTNPPTTTQGAITLCDEGTGAVEVDVGTIAGGGSVTITLEVMVNAPFPALTDEVSNQGVVSGANFADILTDDPDDATSSTDLTVTPIDATPVIVATKVDAFTGTAPQPGDGIDYTILITNMGGQDVSGVFFTDTVDGYSRLDCTTKPPTTTQGTITLCDQSIGAVEVDVGAGGVIASSGGTATITFSVVIANSLPSGVDQISNQGVVSGDEFTDTPTDDPDNLGGPGAENPTTTSVDAILDLRATKRAELVVDQDGDGLADPGDIIRYRVEIENSGNQGAGAVVFADTPDANSTLEFGSVSASQGNVDSGNGQDDTDVQVNLGEVPGNNTVTIEFRVVVKEGLPQGVGSISNQGTVAGSNFEALLTHDPTISGRDEPTVTLLDTDPLIVATKQAQLVEDQDSDGVVDPGDTIAYTVVLRNTGNAEVTGVVFTDTPGANTTLEAGSVTTSQGTVSSGNAGVEVQVGVLPGGATATITFRVMVDRPFGGDVPQVENQGLVAGDTVPNTPTDDPDTPAPDDPTVTPIDLSADLHLEKSASTTTPDVGAEVDFTLALTNNGPAGTVAEVTDELPDGLMFVRADPADAYDPQTGVWTVGALAPETSATLILTALVETTDSVTNTAEVTASTVSDPDSEPGDGSGDDYDEATVTGMIPVFEADPASVDFGDVATDRFADRSVTVTNIGEVDLEIISLALRGSDGGKADLDLIAISGSNGDFSLVSGGEAGTLSVGMARVIVLRFAPSSGGVRSDTLEVVTSTRTLLVPLRGVGLLVAYGVAPASLDFGSLPVGSTRVDSVEVTNTGEVDLEITDVGLSGDDAADFSIVRGGGALPRGASRFIVVLFAPSQRGTRRAQLTFRIRDDSLVVSLQGEGLAAEIAVDPDALDFSDVLPGDSTERTVTITNVGNVDLEITSLLIAGGDSSAFSLISGAAGRLPAGASLVVVVRFAPVRAGAHVDSLVIGSTAGEVSVRLLGNGLAPVLIVTLPPDSLMAGEAATVSVSAPDPFSPTESQLFYRRGGEQDYQQDDLDEETALSGKQGTFTGIIPADFVTERGVDYYVRLSDGRNTVTFPRANPRENPAHVRVRVEQLSSEMTIAPETFRIVSVPLVLDDEEIASVLVDNYGTPALDRWRLFRWNSSDEVYDEFPNLDSTFTPGTAFWLIIGEEGGFEVRDGLSVDASGPYLLTLPPGWSQISTPFAFSIDWDRVEASGEVEAPVAYDGATYAYDQLILQPWEGYFVFNAEPVPVTLVFPPVEAAAEAGKHAASRSSSAAGVYTLRLAAEMLGYGLNDTQNVLGLAHEAADGHDDLDRAEAPPIGDHVRLSIVEDDDRFAVNFKPVQGQGQQWDVEVTALVASEAVALRKHVRVRLVEQGQLPEGFGRYVLDRDYDTPMLLDANTFTVTLSTDQPTRHLSVIVGTEAFAADHSDGVPLTPLADVLEQNYPNPFNPETVIVYHLSRRSRVVLEVYDGLGRRMRTLVDAEQTTGRHQIAWDGRNDEGRAVASGMYFYRLRTGSFTATRAMTLLR